MYSDLTLPVDGGFFNFRVGAIIPKDGRFLMVESARGYHYSVGGRVRFGETTEQAILREVEEETGVRLAIDRLGFIEENYFYGDSPHNRGKLIYELGFYFYMKVPEGFEPVSLHFQDGSTEERLAWVSPDTDKALYPSFFRSAISAPPSGVCHLVKDDREESERRLAAWQNPW